MVLGRSPGSLHPIQRVALHRHHASRKANGKDMVWRSICQLAVQFFLVITAAKIPANFCLAAARGFTQGRRDAGGHGNALLRPSDGRGSVKASTHHCSSSKNFFNNRFSPASVSRLMRFEMKRQ